MNESLDSLLQKSLIRQNSQREVSDVRYLFFDGINIFSFSVQSVSRNKVFHRIRLQLPTLQEELYKNIKEKQDSNNIDLIEKAVLASFQTSVRVFCSCEDFLYSGAKYWCYHNDCGLEPEDRKPMENKYKKYTLLCKHIRFILYYMLRYKRSMSRDIMRNLQKNWDDYYNKMKDFDNKDSETNKFKTLKLNKKKTLK